MGEWQGIMSSIFRSGARIQLLAGVLFLYWTNSDKIL